MLTLAGPDGMDVVKTMEKLGRDTGKPKAEVCIESVARLRSPHALGVHF